MTGTRPATGAGSAWRPDFTPFTSKYTTIQISPTRGAMIRKGLIWSSRVGKQERRERVRQVRDGGQDEHDPKGLREQAGSVGEIAERR